MAALRQCIRTGLSRTQAVQTMSASRGYATGKGFPQTAFAQTHLRNHAEAMGQVGQATVPFLRLPLAVDVVDYRNEVTETSMRQFLEKISTQGPQEPRAIFAAQFGNAIHEVMEPPMKEPLEESITKGPVEPRAIIIAH